MTARSENWDDLRLFLAVARSGTLSGAARELGLNHSTLFRRVGAFEEALGVRLFDRLQGGYALTAAGEAMREGALKVEEEIAAMFRKLTGQDVRLSGTVRITTVDMLAQGLLPRHLSAFRTAYPDIEIELVASNAALNLSRREADIALRVGNDPPESLVGRRVGRLVFAAYASTGYHERRPGGDFSKHDWVGLDSEHAPLARRFARFLPGVAPVFRANSVAVAIAAAKAGIGLAVLPCGLADTETDLVRVGDLPDDFTLDLWLLTHADLRHMARIRAVMEFLGEALHAEADLLEGRRPRV